MKKIMLVLLAITLTLIACGPGPMNPDAHSLLTYSQRAFTEVIIGQQRCASDRIQCETRLKDEGKNTHICFEEENTCNQTVMDAYANRMNTRFLAACKAVVLGPGSEVDTDGDGISNAMEVLIGTSPCHKETFYGINDGKLDSDFDGKPNSTDENQFCHPKFQSDCI
jgi:hypothetical protein